MRDFDNHDDKKNTHIPVVDGGGDGSGVCVGLRVPDSLGVVRVRFGDEVFQV